MPCNMNGILDAANSFVESHPLNELGSVQSLEKVIAVAEELAGKYNASELAMALAIKEAAKSGAKLYFEKASSGADSGSSDLGGKGVPFGKAAEYHSWVEQHLSEILYTPYASTATMAAYSKYLSEVCNPFNLYEFLRLNCVLNLIVAEGAKTIRNASLGFAFEIELLSGTDEEVQRFSKLPFGILKTPMRRLLVKDTAKSTNGTAAGPTPLGAIGGRGSNGVTPMKF